MILGSKQKFKWDSQLDNKMSYFYRNDSTIITAYIASW